MSAVDIDTERPVRGHGAGRALWTLAALFLLVDSLGKLLALEPVMEANRTLELPLTSVFGVGVLEGVCGLLLLLPRTSVFGALLLTGYLGGAAVVHMRLGQPCWFPIVFGAVVWLGLMLSHARLRRFVLGELARAWAPQRFEP